MGGTESRQWVTVTAHVVSSSNTSSKMPCTPPCMITVPDKTIDKATNKGHMSSNQRDAVKNQPLLFLSLELVPTSIHFFQTLSHYGMICQGIFLCIPLLTLLKDLYSFTYNFLGTLCI